MRKHCINVGNYSKSFAQNNNLEFQNLALLIGLLHDMGKYSESFCEHINRAWEAEQNGERYICSKKPDHGKYGAIYIWKKLHNSGNTEFEKLTAKVIAFVICCHHGGLQNMVDNEDKVFHSRMLKRISDEKDYEEVEKRYFEDFDRNEIDELADNSVKEITVIRNKMKRDCSRNYGYIIKLLYSILTDADRLDSAEFEAHKYLIDVYSSEKLFNEYAENLEEYITNFKLKDNASEKEKAIFALRSKISDECLNFSKNNNGVYCLTVPTGGGKTISGFRFALNHALKQKMNRIIYVAPYTTIIEQNAKVIRKALQCGNMLFEHHSNIINEEEVEESEQDIGINSTGYSQNAGILQLFLQLLFNFWKVFTGKALKDFVNFTIWQTV